MTLSAVLLYMILVSGQSKTLASIGGRALGQDRKINLRKLVEANHYFALVAEFCRFCIALFPLGSRNGMGDGRLHALFHAIS